MKINFPRFRKYDAVLIAILMISVAGCKMGDSTKDKTLDEDVDSSSTKLLKIDKVMFSVPSPIQVSMMIKKSGANYNKASLNSTLSATNYSTNFSKAINLGVYGADLGYTTIYDQTQDAIAFLNVIKQMADALGVSGAFEKNTMQRFQNNIGVKDSVLAIITEAFRSSDGYLKNNQRKDVGALVIAGGWIEALYFMTNAVKTTSDQELITRIGEQKITLDNLVKLLMAFQEQKEIGALIDKLLELSSAYEGIQFSYTYKEPTVDTTKQLTVINSESKVTISKEQLTAITEKITAIRTEITK